MDFAKVWCLAIICLLSALCTNGLMASLNDINLANYSKISIPYLEDDSKTADVNVSMYILNIGNLNTEEMTFEVEMYFDMKWTDPRLAFKDYHNASYALVKGPIAYENIWIPDLFIRNMKHTESSKFLMDLSGLTIYSDGVVSLSSRIRVVAHCEMKLLLYPFDTQTCNLVIVPYIYSTDVLTMNWGENPVQIDLIRDGLKSAKTDDSLMGFSLERTLTTSRRNIYPASGMEFQYLIVSFVMKRQPQYYILRSFIPSSLLVCLTWASFWLPTSSYPARVALIVTSFLASIVLYQGSTLNVHQMTVMQIFLFGNISFIVVTLLEYILAVKIYERNNKNYQVLAHDNKAFKGVHQTKEKHLPADIKVETVNKIDEQARYKIDEQARYKIPFIYLVYAVVFVVVIILNQD